MPLPRSAAIEDVLAPAQGRPVIVFDGDCVMCSGSAQFVLRHDRRGRFRLATAQGDAGRTLYRELGLRADEEGTILLVEDGRVATESDAVVGIAAGLGWPFRAALLARLVPAAWRDAAYRFVARRRYAWFGRREACWNPEPGQAERVL